MKLHKKRLIALDLSIGSYKKFIAAIKKLGESDRSSYVCVANVHMLCEAYRMSGFSKVVNNADLVTPDGMPLAKAIQILYGIKQDRVAGMDLLPNLLELAESEGLKVFFYGGTPMMLEHTQNFCKIQYPNLKISGLISPPFRQLTAKEEEEYVQKINASGSNFVFVALGCPKQENWMASMKGKINACMIGIGGALPVMIGMQKRAPKWMQKASLEWLYRLWQEPKRLFKRYFYTNSLFIILFVKELVGKKLKGN